MPPREQAPSAQPQQRPPIGTVVAGVAAYRAGQVPPAAAKAAVAAVVKAIEAAFALRLPLLPAAIIGAIREVYAEIPEEDARRIARIEIAREREFQRRTIQRVREDLFEALKIGDPKLRGERIQAILDREARYGRMREEALHARAVARAEQEILKTTSPQGAFWRLSDLTAGNHTADCIAMANKFWPWRVLDVLHPPLHLNCPCTLHTKAEAIARGWMTERGVVDESTGMARARRIMRAYPEHSIARRELFEGRFDEVKHPRSRVGRFIDRLGLPAYKVGGAVRDSLLGRVPKDEDYVMIAKPDEIADRVRAAGGRPDELIVRDRVVGIRAYHADLPAEGVEIAPPRIERSTGPSRHDFEIVPHPGLDTGGVSTAQMLIDDAVRRDFTLNALYEDPTSGRAIDPTGTGRDDLTAGLLRTTSPESFRDDPLRMLRAIRFVAQFGFNLAPETEAQASEHAGTITNLTRKGVSDTAVKELNKTLMGDHVGKALRTARDTGVLQSFLPELAPIVGWDQRSRYHDLTLDEHTFSVVENAAAAHAPLEVRLAALFHDAGKPQVAWEGKDGFLHFYGAPENDNVAHERAGAEIALAALTRLNYPQAVRDKVVRLVQEHMVPLAAAKKANAARRFRAQVGPDLVEPLLMLRRADVTAKGEDAADDSESMLDAFAERVRSEVGSPTSVRDLEVGGDDLKAIGYPEGPEIGQALEKLLHEVISNPKLNDREWLLRRAAALRLAEADFDAALHPRDRRGRFRDVPFVTARERLDWATAGPRSFGAIADAVEIPESRPLGVTGRIAKAIGERLDGFEYGGIRATYVGAFGGIERVGMRFFTSGEEEVGYSQMSVAGDHIHLDRLYLEEDHRGRGFGSAFTMELLDTLRERGIERLTLETADIGGYAWARAGFLFDGYSSGKSVLHNAMQMGRVDRIEEAWGGEIAGDLKRFIEDEERSEYEIAMWGREYAQEDSYFGRVWPGKMLMLHAQWEGALDVGVGLHEAAAPEHAAAVTTVWEQWVRDGKLHVWPDDISSDDDLAFWDEVEAKLGLQEAVNWREILHPRNRLGKFVNKPSPGLVSPQDEERQDAIDRVEAALATHSDDAAPAIEGMLMQPLAGALGALGFDLSAADEDSDQQVTEWVHGASGTTLTISSENQMVVEVGWHIPKRVEAKRAEHPIRSWPELQADTLALADELVEEYGAQRRLRGFGIDATLGDTSGMHGWNGDAWIGPDAIDIAELAGSFRGEDEDVPDDVLGPLYFAELVAAHEISHSVNPIAAEDYVYSNINRALEEALTEESSIVLAVRRLRGRGETDTLEWLRKNQPRPYGQGTYHAERAALQLIFDKAGVAPEDREDLILRLKFVAPPNQRLDFLGELLLANGKSEKAAINILKRLDVADNGDGPLTRLGPFNVAPDLEGVNSRPHRIGFGSRVYEVGQEVEVISWATSPGEEMKVLNGRVLDGTSDSLIIQSPLGLLHVTEEADILTAHKPGEVELPGGGSARVGDEIEYMRPDGRKTQGRLVWVHRRRAGDFLVEVRVGGRTVIVTPTSTKDLNLVRRVQESAVGRGGAALRKFDDLKHPRGDGGKFRDTPGPYSAASPYGGKASPGVKKPLYEVPTEPPKLDWTEPPEPKGSGSGKAGGFSASGKTNTEIGDLGEKVVEALDLRSLLPPGRRQNPLDAEYDHSGMGFEIKTSTTDAKEYKVAMKSAEIESKVKYAEEHELRGGMMIVVLDVDGKQAWAYWREGIGNGRLRRDDGWNFMGHVKL